MAQYVGGFLGGGVQMVPEGYMQVLLQWNTEEDEYGVRKDISGASFKLTGDKGEYEVQGDDSGRAEIIIPSGAYTVEVSHTGTYQNDAPQTLIGSSAQTYFVLFDAYIRGSGVSFTSPPTRVDATYEISTDGSVDFTGVGWSKTMSFSIGGGTHTLKLELYGVSVSMNFTVISGTLTNIDTSELFCKLDTSSLPHGTSVKIGDYDVTKEDSSTSYILKSDKEITLTFIPPSYEGASSDPIATISDFVFTPSESQIIVSPSVVGTMVLITSSGNLTTIPGKYRVLVIGGGGSGGYGWPSVRGGGGGGGGEVSEDILELNQGSYECTIGLGGASLNARGGTVSNEPRPAQSGNSGGATSFGALISASGGQGGGVGGTFNGGSGGSGGGGGGTWQSSNTISHNGGNGSFGGGGGGGCGYSPGSGTSIPGGSGGTGGIHGGNGGSGGNTSEPPSSGSPGDSNSDSFYGPTGTGPGGSSYTNLSACIGGGGGGGLGASGGHGALSSSKNSGGGGGGGLGGGSGGSGNSQGEGYGASGGFGYGAGGGGGTAAQAVNSWSQPAGGGGGGLSSTKVSGNGSSISVNSDGNSSLYYVCGSTGKGADGAIKIQWLGSA